MNWINGDCVVTGVSSVLVFSVLASVWAKSRSPGWFALSLVVAWIIVATLPVSAPPWERARFPVDAAHFVANMIWAVPFLIAGVLGLAPFVAAGASRKEIVIASIVASVVAVPVSFISGLFGLSSIGDRL
jgi:hypothetical protein